MDNGDLKQTQHIENEHRTITKLWLHMTSRISDVFKAKNKRKTNIDNESS